MRNNLFQLSEIVNFQHKCKKGALKRSFCTHEFKTYFASSRFFM